MSNKSYSFKENSYVIVNQGGEKKVMKKILSVALSTAMAFSMFATVAFGADAKLTPEQQFNALKDAGIVEGFPDGQSHLDRSLTRAELAKIITKATDLTPVDATSYNDKNYAKHWARTYIEAVTQAGIMEGKNTEKKLFDPSGNLSVQELAAVLVRALKLEVPADANNTASEWAKGFVEAAVKGGYIDAGINYQANASRSQAIVAAYAIYEASQVPTVASYTVSEAGKVVEFTLSNKEVVKVTLEKALEPNKETEVKFTHNEHEYTHKVTYVTTTAQSIQKVTADNLKEVVVAFDGTVDEVSATLKDNYSVDGKKVSKVTLSEDKSSVKLLLDSAESNTLKNQREIELSVKNVKNSDGTKTFDQKVKFTPVDVAAPTVKEVVGLGTKAFKIKFSEPIRSGAAVISGNYKVDGKAIGASVKYSYPDTVIVSTNLPEGDHKVSVSNIEDFSGLKVAPVDNDFKIAVDTAAPEVVSVKANDLTEVVVTFNETIKSVEDAYANVTSRKATNITINDNEVVLRFDDKDKPLNYGENTIHLTGVSDYSDNKSDREAKVTPVLDTTRPTIVGQEFKTENGFYKLVLSFSETLEYNKAQDRKNYVLKTSDGKIADKAGVNGSGNPVYQPVYNSQDKTVTLNLGSVGSLDDSTDYIVSVSGLTDAAYVPNTILPVDVKFNTRAVAVGGIDRVWVENISGDESYVYVQFNRSVKTEGEGSALEPQKYTLATTGEALTTEKNDISIITSNTVRITTKDTTLFNNSNELKSAKLVISYVADSEGKYFVAGNKYSIEKDIKLNASDILELKKAEATSKKEVVLEFSGKLANVNRSDFEISTGTGTYSAVNYKLSNDGKTLTLIYDEVIPADANAVSIRTVPNAQTQDEFGNKVQIAGKVLDDQIRPEFTFSGVTEASTATGSTYYDLTFVANEKIKKSAEVTDAFAASLFTVKFNEVEAKAVTDANAFQISSTDEKTVTIRVYVPTAKAPATGAVVTVKFDGEKNSSAGALVDLGNKSKAVNVLNAWKNL